MTVGASTRPLLPIADAVLPPGVLARLALVVAGVALLTLSAKVQIPLWPVPMTMQTYVVLVVGMAYGPALGLLTVGAYLAAGAFGLPVFAGTPEKGVGLAYMMGPTGGYLVGFLVATGLMGALVRLGWDRRLSTSLIAMTAGHLLILALGVAWLASIVGIDNAIALGFTPFIAATVVKTALAAVTLPLAWKWLKRAG